MFVLSSSEPQMMNSMLAKGLLIVALVAIGHASGDKPLIDADLVAEHRSASPEPLDFLSRLKNALFNGGEEKSGPPGPQLPNRPTYNRPLQGQPSFNKPVVAVKGQGQAPGISSGYGVPQAPVIGSRPQGQGRPGPRPQSRPPPPVRPQQSPNKPIYQAAPSNSFPSFFGGGGSKPGRTPF